MENILKLVPFLTILSLTANVVVIPLFLEMRKRRRYLGSVKAPVWRAQVAYLFLGRIASANLPTAECRLVMGLVAQPLMYWVLASTSTAPAVPEALAHLVGDIWNCAAGSKDREKREGFLVAILIALPELRPDKCDATKRKLFQYFSSELEELRKKYTTLPMPEMVH